MRVFVLGLVVLLVTGVKQSQLLVCLDLGWSLTIRKIKKVKKIKKIKLETSPGLTTTVSFLVFKTLSKKKWWKIWIDFNTLLVF